MKKHAVGAWTMIGVMAFGSLLTTAALAGEPQTKKKPPTKGKNKPATKKPDNKALIAEGRKVYEANGCQNCHAVAGKGAKSGPDLTKIAADSKHNAKWMEEAITNPKVHNPSATMPAFDSIKGKELKALVAYMLSLK
jgi:mono/diheme cytochrome c family protein